MTQARVFTEEVMSKRYIHFKDIIRRNSAWKCTKTTTPLSCFLLSSVLTLSQKTWKLNMDETLKQDLLCAHLSLTCIISIFHQQWCKQDGHFCLFRLLKQCSFAPNTQITLLHWAWTNVSQRRRTQIQTLSRDSGSLSSFPLSSLFMKWSTFPLQLQSAVNITVDCFCSW